MCETIVPYLSQPALLPFPFCLDFAKMCLHERWGKGRRGRKAVKRRWNRQHARVSNTIEIIFLTLCCNMTKLWYAPIRCWGSRSRMRNSFRNSNNGEGEDINLASSVCGVKKVRVASPFLPQWGNLTHSNFIARQSTECNDAPNRLLHYCK